MDSLVSLLAEAFAARADLFDANHETAFRLFHGFSEGCPTLAIEIYARTIVLHDYANAGDFLQDKQTVLREIQEYLYSQFPWLRAILLKTHRSSTFSVRQGVLLYGEKVDRRIREHGVRYAIELRMHGDTSFYLGTRNLRAWAVQHLNRKTVLNTFAYTGSLGVAALAGGARHVVYLDHNRSFLNVAKASYSLNGFSFNKADFQVGDFWTQVNHLKRVNQRFDCVLLDPPFFSTTNRGTVDLVTQSQRVINKVRPLINDGGYLVSVNNALFVSGVDYLRSLEVLCADGYLSIEELLPVPLNCTGYPQTTVGALPADPTPFNHSTKIAILRVRRK